MGSVRQLCGPGGWMRRAGGAGCAAGPGGVRAPPGGAGDRRVPAPPAGGRPVSCGDVGEYRGDGEGNPVPTRDTHVRIGWASSYVSRGSRATRVALVPPPLDRMAGWRTAASGLARRQPCGLCEGATWCGVAPAGFPRSMGSIDGSAPIDVGWDCSPRHDFVKDPKQDRNIAPVAPVPVDDGFPSSGAGCARVDRRWCTVVHGRSGRVLAAGALPCKTVDLPRTRAATPRYEGPPRASGHRNGDPPAAPATG